jgi:aspartate carbamoyltransferase catalytic subunit
MRHVISIADLGNEEIEEIFELADGASKLRQDRPASGKIMATLFYEPSTRTRLSFESAMQRLGGSVISCSDMKSSSAAKGESIADTAKVVGSYADLLVIRHDWDGAVQAMAEYAEVPVINAGDGSHEHPTQTLCDLYTLKKEKGHLSGLNVVICGDLKNGRTIHSLVYALARFGANVVTLAAGGMELPAFVLDRLEREFQYTLAPIARGDLNAVVTGTDALYLTPSQPHQLALMTDMSASLQNRLTHIVSGLRYDAVYMTRKQKERMKEGTTDGSYPTIGSSFLREERFRDTVVMHPLPRVDELSPEVDRDRRGIYFKQAAYGVPVRMGLLHFLFQRQLARGGSRFKTKRVLFESPEPAGPRCMNANCVTAKEPRSTRPRFEFLSGGAGALILRCVYCDHQFKTKLIGNAKEKKYCGYDIASPESLKQWRQRGELMIFDSIKQAEELAYQPFGTAAHRIVMDEKEIAAAVGQLSMDILRDTDDPDRLLLVGIRSGGARLAQKIATQLERDQGRKYELGEIEVYGSGEDVRRVSPANPELGPIQLRDRAVVLVDDVIHTGRTVNRALSMIFRAGRPRSVRLAVLIDRGHREVPVRPNYVGKNIPSSEHDRVRVTLGSSESDGVDKAVIYSMIRPDEERQAAAITDDVGG